MLLVILSDLLLFFGDITVANVTGITLSDSQAARLSNFVSHCVPGPCIPSSLSSVSIFMETSSCQYVSTEGGSYFVFLLF